MGIQRSPSPLPLLRVAAVLAALLLPEPGPRAQTTAELEPAPARSHDFPLTLGNIMRGQELVGTAPSQLRWTDDSRWIYFRWLPGGEAWNTPAALHRIPAEGGEPERLDEAAADSLMVLVAPGDLSRDRRFRVSSVEGDLHLVDRATMEVRRLTRTASSATDPRFSADGSRVVYREGTNLFSLTLEGGEIRQLTDLWGGAPPREEPEPTPQRAFLQAEEEALLQHVRFRAEARDREEEARERRESRRLPRVYLGEGREVGAVVPDPTVRFAAVTAPRPAPDARNTMVPAWVTASSYTEPLDSRTRVGDAQSVGELALLSLESGELTWLPLEEAVAGTPGLEELRVEGEPPFVAVTFLGWNDQGTRGLLSAISYGYNFRWTWALDPLTGGLTLLDRLYDEAWVAGPCASGCAGWLPGSSRAYFVSEESGFAHLYAVEADGTGRAALTAGEWEVLSVEIPEDRSGFLLRTNEGSPHHQHVYRMAFHGGERAPLTSGPGQFLATPSPDGTRLALVHSRANRPPELFLMEDRPGAVPEQITVSPTLDWLTFPWLEPEIVHVPARDGARVPARIYRPREVGVESNGAAVIFVHGAGYLQNVHTWWSSYYREYMFHHFLAMQGYTVLDLDYRASAGYGRDWRTAIYRHMGGWDLSDHTDGARWLVAREGVDPGRVGIYGGSYGGFITLMALFNEPETFAAGAALRSVTDWAHYNHGYTARILNQPQEDAEAYRRSSPIYFAEGLQGHLLITHGMVDTNVHFSDVVRLAQRLIELGKENWELAIHPVENHGYVEPSSWTDNYRRIFLLFRNTIGRGDP